MADQPSVRGTRYSSAVKWLKNEANTDLVPVLTMHVVVSPLL